jgi:L-ascorbate metabolism protein UlaG (beta-lactamase superfamily)
MTANLVTMQSVRTLLKQMCAKHLTASFCVVVLLLLPSCRPIRSLGKNPHGEELKKMEAQPNYRDGAFHNTTTFPADSNASVSRAPSWTRMLKYFTHRKPANTRPLKPLPVVVTNLKDNPYPAPTVIWFGHSAFLLKTATANILFDAALSDYAGPFKSAMPAFDFTYDYRVADLPPINALVISHDHYDHLDYPTVKALKKKVKHVIVPMGVGSHFKKWGYASRMITELNWNDSTIIDKNITLIATQAHHRSNRTFAQNKTLWASYVIEADGYKVYFSGDTGYSPHFKSIGEIYGPFDLALLECGQYNQKWPHSHMFPSQTARAAVDLKASVVLPLHWAKFAESEHQWNEPVKLLLSSADSLTVHVVVPFIGQPYSIKQPFQQVKWWEF